MKVSINWIKDYIDLPEDINIDDLAYDLTMRTVEIEDVYKPQDKLDGIVVGQIKKIEAHPDADKLVVTKVDVGQDELLQIVCGGTNLYEDQLVAVAVPGAEVRWHGEGEPVKIEDAKLRGVLSQGMICGANELDLDAVFPAAETEILDLSFSEANPGASLAEAIGLDDYVLEIDNKSMTHRPDLWGHYGIARELAAIYDLKLKELPELDLDKSSLEEYPVKIESDKCKLYSAYVIENLKVEPSPLELRLRLWEVDVRPINNLVDLTNYVMLSTGQPTHGFDNTHVNHGIIVRQAKEDEELELLDSEDLHLSPTDMVIADKDKALALAGIMGGKHDSILKDTDSMILEIASFDAKAVRLSSKRHGVRTESSTRFEKSIDTKRVEDAEKLALNLIKKLIPEAEVVAYGHDQKEETKAAEITVSYDYLNSRIGVELSPEEIHQSLEPLGFEIIDEDEDKFTVKAPIWRSTGDISLPADILEEIARMIGYENFDFLPPVVKLESFVNQKDKDLIQNVHEYLAFRCGFQEIYTYPWTDDFYIKACSIDASDWLKLQAAPAPDQNKLRATLVPNILEAVVKNVRYKDEFKIFEQAQVYSKGDNRPSQEDEVLPNQDEHLAGALVGADPIKLFREAKGVLEMLGRYNHCSNLSFAQEEKASFADPNLWLNITLDSGEVIGDLALVSPKTASLAGLKNHYAIIFEFNLEKLEALDSRTNSYEKLNQYQIVWQDINLLVPKNLKWKAISKELEPLVLDYEFIEEYHDKDMPEDEKSVLFRIWLGADDHTLSSEEIDEQTQAVISKLKDEFGAKLKD